MVNVLSSEKEGGGEGEGRKGRGGIGRGERGGEIHTGRAPAALGSGVSEKKTPLVELELAKVRQYACLATRV